MNKLLLFSFVISCCLIGFSHSSVCTNKTVSQAAASASALNIVVDSSYTPTFNYYYTSGNTVEAFVQVCADGAVNPLIGISSDANTVTLTVQSMPSTLSPEAPTAAPTQAPTMAQPPKTVSSASGRSPFSPFAAIMSICLACVFAFPKQRFSFFVVFVVVALAFYTPVTQAQAGTIAVTINVGVPSTFTSICRGTNCLSLASFPYVISLGNKAFSTVDQAAGGCTAGQGMKIPSGWTIAPESDDAGLVITFNNWTADYIFAGSAPHKNGKYSEVGTGSYNHVGDTVSVSDCSYKVLITPSVQGSFPLDPKNTLISTVPGTNFVTFNDIDYAVADDTPYGTTSRVSQSRAVFIQSGDAWQVATYATTAGSAQVAVMSQTNSFGAECIAMSFGSAYNSYNASTFGICGSSDIVSVQYGSGRVYGVARGGSYTTKMLVSRASPKAGTLDSWNTMPVITETYELGGVLYAMMDNAPVNGSSASACQGRFFAAPSSDWYYASDAQLSALIADLPTSNKWANTNCFANYASSKSRSGVAGCAGTLIESVGLSKFFRTSSACARHVMVHSKPAASFNIGLKVAIITATLQSNNDSVTALAVSMLEARQIPYDVYYTTSSTASLPLMNGANPAYYALVLVESLVISAPNTALQTAIVAYKFNYDVRMVTLNSYPDTKQGLKILSNKVSSSNNFYLDAAFATNFAEHIDGVVPTSLFEIATNTSAYITVVPGYNAVPFLRATALNSNTVTANDDIVGAFVTSVDGTEELQFFAPLNGNAYAGPILANVWISWVTRGLYLGYRRIYFSPQIDDLLLGTQQYSNDSFSARMSYDDMKLSAEYYENELPKSLPAGSYVTLTFGINGWGQTNVTAFSANGDDYGIVASADHDPLADSIVDFYDSFFWESHTFSHKDFTCFPEPDPDNPSSACQSYTTAQTITNELLFNNRYFNEQLFKNFGGIDAPRFSPQCFITPAITGLQNNPVSVDAIAAANFTCVVGDNTRPVLIAPNPYDGLFTTTAVNYGANGALFIIPRYATEVYYNTYDPYYLELEYNDRYGPNAKAPFKPFFDHDLSTDEIMVREANANFLHLAALRHDPFMFHQCNCMHWPYTAPGETQQKQWSLVTLWTKAVVDKYISHMNLPLLTVKQQDLQDIYFARRARNACNLAGSVSVNNGVMGAVTVTGNNSTCTPIITGISSCGSTNNCHIDTYAQDSTAYVKLSSGLSASVNVPGNVQW